MNKIFIKLFLALALAIFIAVGVWSYFLKSFEKANAQISDNNINSCSNDSDCYIYSYSSCGCDSSNAINIKYKDDKKQLEKTFPQSLADNQSCQAECGVSLNYAKTAYCINSKCGIYWARKAGF